MQINKDYFLVSFAGKGSYLNISTDYEIVSGLNVNTYNFVQGDCFQYWRLINKANRYKIASAKNPAFVLDRWHGKENPNNADVWLSRNWGEDMSDQLIDLLTLGANTFRIKLVKSNLYLTAGSPHHASNVFWASYVDAPSQSWKANPVPSANIPSIVAGNRPGTLNFDSSTYTKPFNPFTIGQCTWYVFGRAKQATGKTIEFSTPSGRDAANWWHLVTNMQKTQELPLATPAIIVWSSATQNMGHLAFVENFDGTTVFFTEGNWDNNGIVTPSDGIVKQLNIAEVSRRCNLRLKGFLVF